MDRTSATSGSQSRQRRVTSVDADGKLGVEMMKGMEVGMPWEKLSAQDKSQLALSVLREKEPSDHAMLALYLLIAGEDEQAKTHLGKAGGLADEVRSMFE
jgi:hypothetical protein